MKLVQLENIGGVAFTFNAFPLVVEACKRSGEPKILKGYLGA
jgi:hypothetical protein